MATIHQGVDLVPRLSVLGNVLTGAIGEMRAPVALLGGFGHARKRRACALLRSRPRLSELERACELILGEREHARRLPARGGDLSASCSTNRGEIRRCEFDSGWTCLGVQLLPLEHVDQLRLATGSGTE